jgi:site-specific recombinase XerD
MVQDMRLRDLRPKTIGHYALAVRLFLERTGKSPEDATEEDVRAYVLHLRDERAQAPSSINIAVCALRFFFVHTLGREYEVFDLMRVHKPRKLPTVLGREEVRRVLSAIEPPVRRVALTTIYALGLRLGEGLKLETCARCGAERARDWVERQRASLLPVPYFHVVFTVPAELRELVRTHQKKLIKVLFRRLSSR